MAIYDFVVITYVVTNVLLVYLLDPLVKSFVLPGDNPVVWVLCRLREKGDLGAQPADVFVNLGESIVAVSQVIDMKRCVPIVLPATALHCP